VGYEYGRSDTVKKQPIPRERTSAAHDTMGDFVNQPTTSILSGMRYNSDAPRLEPLAGTFSAKTNPTAMTLPLISAALSSLCLVIISFAEYPWFAAAGFVAAYSLFWISLFHQH
jgi:hypothetical protein